MRMEKLISIIIPCYNVEKYIDRCFESLKMQSIGVENLEIIFVDDCSTDATWERLVELEASCPDSVIVVRCDENGRQGKARNIGLSYVSAPYIGFVDADDWVETDMYEKLYKKVCEYDCDIAMCGNWRDSAKEGQILAPKKTGKEDRILHIDTEEKRKIFLACSSIGFGVWDKIYKAELLLDNEIFFPENLSYEDHYFSILLYFYAKRIYFLEERLYHYFINEQSTVLSANAAHHFDILTVDTLLWEECSRRGFLDTYRQELEYQFISLCYLASIKMMLLRLQDIPYDFFVEVKAETKRRVPVYRNNSYVMELVTDTNKILLELLDLPIDKEGVTELFMGLRENIRSGKLRI